MSEEYRKGRTGDHTIHAGGPTIGKTRRCRCLPSLEHDSRPGNCRDTQTPSRQCFAAVRAPARNGQIPALELTSPARTAAARNFLEFALHFGLAWHCRAGGRLGPPALWRLRRCATTGGTIARRFSEEHC